MATTADAIRQFVKEANGRVTSNQIRRAIQERHPNQWKESTVQAHLYACAVNNPKAYIHHPSISKFLYKNADGTYELYSEDVHGANEWSRVPGEDDPSDLDELVEASISLERDIEDHLVQNLGSIESGLQYVDRQVSTHAGRVDILAKDSLGIDVVIEVKAARANDSSIGQVARYIGWYKRQGKGVRAILVAGEFSEALLYAAEAIPELTLFSYKVNFTFERAHL